MNFLSLLSAILPIFSLIALGYGLKASGRFPLETWRPIERFAVDVLYPGFLIPAIWHAPLGGNEAGPIGMGVMGAAVIAAGIGFALKPLLKLNGPSFTSVFQGLIRFNSFVFIPVVTAIYGPAVLKLAAVAISGMIPLSNLVCILVLARWGEPDGLAHEGIHDRSLIVLLRKLFTNSIFLSCLLGLALNFAHIPPQPLLEKPLNLLGQAAIPTGLILAGAGLDFYYMSSRPLMISLTAGFKTLVMPLLSWAIALSLGADRLSQGVALACGAAPCAAAAYVQARQMGGDAPFMAGIVALTTVMSAISMPVLLWALHLV